MLSAVLDHLWQSTLVALAAGVLIAAVFRKARAGVRYGLWFAASLKFLVPFASLATLGRYLAPAGLAPAGVAPEAALIEKTARPLAQFPFAHDAAFQAPIASSPASPSLTAAAPQAAFHLDPALILLAVWGLGCAVVIVRWAVRWARVRRIARSSVPLDWPAPMPVRASSSLMEPGLIGLFRPVLVVPETLPESLTRSEIDAILAHEISHLRRRDNLTAAVHMLVEALFWFHPMVWWIGARMVAERERACDEAVVEAGHDRATYARSLVESCRVYLQSPLSCVAGASGSDLKTRVQAIMTAPPSSPLSPLKKALLLAAGGLAFATPVAAGLLTSPEGQKAVARIAAATSSVVGLPATSSTPGSEPARPIVLARNAAVLGPALSVAKVAAAPTPLSQDIAEPRVASPPPATPSQQLAVASPAAAPSRPAPVSSAMTPADAKKQAADFVKSYAAATPFHTIGRWAGSICVNVVGLSFQQGAAVRDRVVEVADSLGVPAQGVDCQRYNVEIGFTNDPQAMLDNAVKVSKVNPLGDRTSDTRGVKTVTLPIQAWYVTNGELYAENDRPDANGLMVRVLYQPPPGGPPPQGSYNPSPGGPPDSGFPRGGFSSRSTARQFLNVLVIVDLRRTGDANLSALADNAAMLALSEPRALGQCNVLPSITDLFATCPGRAAPEGLTPADTAFLEALYTAQGAVIGESHQSHVVQRMADLLVNPSLAALDAKSAKDSESRCRNPTARFIGSRAAQTCSP